MAISSLGIGSGLDIGSLVSQLVAAEGSNKQTRLDNKEIQLQAKLSAMGTVKSALSTFQSSYRNLKLASTYSKLSATSSNTDLFTATATGSNVDKSTRSIEVLQLSQAQKLATSGGNIADTAASIGTGTLTFDFGEYDYTVGPPYTYADEASRQKTVTITDGSLTGIRDAINDADIGVTASVLYDGSSYQLVMSTESGASNGMRISVSGDSDADDTDNAGLSMFAYDGTAVGASNMSETLQAKDAQVKIDGVSISSSTDTISDAIAGVTLNLKKAEINTVSTLSISGNTAGLSTAVESFVSSFNELAGTLKAFTYYDAETKQKGLFVGDSVLRNIENRLRNVMGNSVSTVTDPSVTYNSFAMVGITTKSDGSLEFDSSKFSSALSANLEEVRNLFAGGLAETSNSTVASNLNFGYVPTGINASSLSINITAAATHGTFTGAAFASAAPYTMDATDTLSLKVDGGAAITIDTVSGSLTETEVASQLQTNINAALQADGQSKSVVVSYDAGAGAFSIASNKWGSASSIEITDAQGDYSANLGFAVTAAQTGTDVAGTIGGEAATGSGRTLTGSGSLYDGLEVEYIGSTSTFSTNVKNIQGVLPDLDEVLDGFLESGGILSARNNSFNTQIKDIGEQRKTLLTRLSSLEQRYLIKFGAMDAIVAQMNATSDYLTNQLKNLPGTSRNK